MVGTDPKLGSKTTIIPTVIIPLRFVFPDGQVFDASSDLIDGQTPIQGIINSPIFKNYNFVLGGKSVGNTQYGDAFQRANFWDSVSTKAKDYHVLLGQPTVLPTHTIVVPDGLGTYDIDFSTGLQLPNVDRAFLAERSVSILSAANVTPSQLPILVWGSVNSSRSSGYHASISLNGNDRQTYIGTSYHSQATSAGAIPDIYPLSHEVIEWLDDPFISNYTPGWNIPFISDHVQCDSRYARDLLETGDPVETLIEAVVPLNGGGFTYHVTEGMFIDFYTRSRRSRSINGQYSMFNIGAQYSVPSAPSTPCTGHVELNDRQLYAIQGSSYSEAFGVNNVGSIVGVYLGQDGLRHGWLSTTSSFQTFDYPGALETIPSQINDVNAIVGLYIDSSGRAHGFVLSGSQFSSIDYPGGLDTLAFDVNLNGDIIGAYTAPDFTTHGFLFHNGSFSSIDFPFNRSTVATGINLTGKIVGYHSVQYGSGSGYPYLGFLLAGKKTSEVIFPGASEVAPQDINNSSDITGLFFNTDQYGDGFATINSFAYEVYGSTFSMNDAGDVVGSYNFGGNTYTMLGRLPAPVR
jgi:probable HAF family extracellular repeat protein